MAAEHVFAEQSAVAVKTDTLRIEDDLGTASEITDDFASRRGDLFEEETAIHIGPGHSGEILDAFSDGTLVDDRADQEM